MAARYFINGGVNSNYSTNGNWSATSGGAASGVAPTSSDTVFFDANSPACTLNADGVAQSLNFTGYTNTFAMSTFSIDVSGSTTYSNTMTLTGTHANGIRTIAASTITTNGFSIPINLAFFSGGGFTVTLADDLNITGRMQLATGGAAITFNGSSIYASSDAVVTSGAGATGTTVLRMVGSGKVGMATPALTGALGLPVVINTAGTVSLGLGTSRNYRVAGGGSFTRTAGTISNINTSGVKFLMTSTGTFTIDCNVAIRNFQFSSGSGQQTLNINGQVLTVTDNVGILSGAFTRTFGGNFGFTCDTFSNAVGAITINFATGKTYTYNGSFAVTGTTTSTKVSLVSTSTGALFVLGASATQNINFTNATYINASSGQTMVTNEGTLSNTTNWAIRSSNFFRMF